MYRITNDTSYPKNVMGQRLEPGDSAEFDVDEEYLSDLAPTHFSIEQVEADDSAEPKPSTDDEPTDESDAEDADDGHTCEECDRTFDSSRGLQTHKAQAHKGGEK